MSTNDARVGLSEADQQEFAVAVTAFSAGRISAQGCLRAIWAHGERILAARDAEHREAWAKVRALAEEWHKSAASGHPNCGTDEDCVACAADEVLAVLPADPQGGAE